MATTTKTDSPHASINHAEPAHARVVLVDWMLGNACNFACSYCPDNLHDGSIRWQTAQVVLKTYDAIRSHYVDRLGRSVWLQFTGGEPTMHPRIIDLLDAASERGFAVSLISNGSRTFRFWEKVCSHLRSVILTYHAESVDHAHFLNVGSLLSAIMPVHINVTMLPDRFDEIYARATELAHAMPTATLSLKPLRIGFGTTLYPYSADQLRLMELGIRVDRRKVGGTTPRGPMIARLADGREERILANQFIIRGLNRWRGWECQAGLESLRVKADGTLYRAVCASGGRIGTIGEEYFELPTEPIICDRDACGCVADILITKNSQRAMEKQRY